MRITHQQNCPICERTGDGALVGRCWMFMADGVTCPRHGNVSEAVELYKSTGKLTKEELRQVVKPTSNVKIIDK